MNMAQGKVILLGTLLLLWGCGSGGGDDTSVSSTSTEDRTSALELESDSTLEGNSIAEDLHYDAGTSELLTTEEQKVILLHNQKRNIYFSDVNLTYSTHLEEEAQRYANLLASTGKFEHDSTVNHEEGYGENLYAYSKDQPLGIEDAMPHWFDEEMPLYNYEDGSCQEAYYDNGTPIKCGHYTQVIWQETQEVGCATAQYTTGAMKGGYVYVCKYQKAGNIEGEKPYCSNYSNADILLNNKPNNIALANHQFTLEFREEDRTVCSKRDYFNSSISFSADLEHATIEDFEMITLTYNGEPAKNTLEFDQVSFDGETINLKGINKNIPAQEYQDRGIFMNIKLIGETEAYLSAEIEWNALDSSNPLFTRTMKAKLYKE